MECISAYRTPARPGISRPGVVIAEMRCLRDKRSVLERKWFIRHLPQYQHVFIKASKFHTEQVVDANFSFILNEMKNGDEYYVSDNGRIRRKIRDSNDHVDIVRYTDQAQRYNSNREHYESHLLYLYYLFYTYISTMCIYCDYCVYHYKSTELVSLYTLDIGL